MIITWDGTFEGSGAYPTINRHLSAAVERLGHTVLRNYHNDGDAIAEVLVSCHYPPRPSSMRHEINVCLSTWEFAGPQGTPHSFLTAFEWYDRVYAMCKYSYDIFQENGVSNAFDGYLGVDPDEFCPTGEEYELDIPEGKVVLLWVGGTDKRHGFDIALKVAADLPDEYFLVAKQSVHYPPHEAEGDNMLVLREDLPSLAPLYRRADILLHTARAAAPGLTVIEALACGLRVVSTPLPAVQELRTGDIVNKYLQISSEEVRLELMEHHLHQDCLPYWIEPDHTYLVDAIRKIGVPPTRMPAITATEFGNLWSWDDSALRLMECLEGKN